jgi:hypothetical protein
MNEGRYKSGRTVGGNWGCAIAVLLGAPLFIFLVIVEALGDCAPDIDCHKGFLPNVAAPCAIVMLVSFFIVRALVNHMRSNDN